MPDELDLERGDASRADATSERRSRRRQRDTGSSSRAAASEDAEVEGQLSQAWERVAEWREARDDDELSEAIREDADVMTKGFVSLTSNFKPLRRPLIIFLNVILPLFAFARVGRILLTRWVERRERRIAEREAVMQEAEQFNGSQFDPGLQPQT
jgi:hypothetical protein